MLKRGLLAAHRSFSRAIVPMPSDHAGGRQSFPVPQDQSEAALLWRM
jgi:hypothetical protein